MIRVVNAQRSVSLRGLRVRAFLDALRRGAGYEQWCVQREGGGGPERKEGEVI